MFQSPTAAHREKVLPNDRRLCPENSLLKRIRRIELEVFEDILRASDENSGGNATVVELGGGSGYLAREMTAMGLSVRSFDPNPRQPLEFPVEKAFADDLPVTDGKADFVVGAHVLEHIPEPYLSSTFREVERILKPSGKAILLLPSSWAMVLTIILQPAGNMRRLFIHLKPILGLGDLLERTPCNNPLVPKRVSFRMKLIEALTIRWILPAPHGVGKTALHEIWNWRSLKWSAVFAQNGFEVIDVRKSGFAASNHQLFGDRLWYFRRLLAMLGMHASNVFILRKH